MFKEKMGSSPEESKKSREETYEEKKKREDFENQRFEIISKIIESKEAPQDTSQLLKRIENVDDDEERDNMLLKIAEAEAKNGHISKGMEVVEKMKDKEKIMNVYSKIIPYIAEEDGVEAALAVTHSVLLMEQNIKNDLSDDWLLKTIKSIVSSMEGSEKIDQIIDLINENITKEEQERADSIYSFLSIYQARQGNISAALEINTLIYQTNKHPETTAEIAIAAAQKDDIETAVQLIENLNYMKDEIGEDWLLEPLEKVTATEAGHKNIEMLLSVVDINITDNKDREKAYAALAKGEIKNGHTEKAREILKKIKDTNLLLETLLEISTKLSGKDRIKNSMEISQNLMKKKKQDEE